MRDGEAGLGFVEGPRRPQGLDGRVVATDELLVVVASTHPWARRRRPLVAAELARTRLVHREPTSGTRAALEAALAAHLPLATPVLELSSTSAVRSAVSAGAGPAVLSSLAVQDDLAAGRLVAVAVEGVGPRDVPAGGVARRAAPHRAGPGPVGDRRATLGATGGAGGREQEPAGRGTAGRADRHVAQAPSRNR